jgi:predicted phosphodiesterase
MLVLVISDIHANSVALEAVLKDALHNPKHQVPDATWCLGDLVGYGPKPNECVQLVQELPNLTCLIGNHDQAALGLVSLQRFNQDARVAAAWTSEHLSAESKEYLQTLPSEHTWEAFTLTHGSPRKPAWEYILDPHTADENFDYLTTEYCLVGHSHLPLIFFRANGAEHTIIRPVLWGEAMSLTPRMILNPGSVGQPRDLDPRAAYAVLDLDRQTWTARRVSYDVESVKSEMLELGLPDRQALRLLAGW